MNIDRHDFQAILNSMDDGIFVSDRNSTIRMVNKAVEKTGGMLMEDLVGRRMEDLVAEGYVTESVTCKVT